MLFMDTDVSSSIGDIVETCADSDYTIDDLERILFNESLPALRFNLMSVAGEWRGFETEGLKRLVLEKHRFGRRRPWLFRKYTSEKWAVIRPMIERHRSHAS